MQRFYVSKQCYADSVGDFERACVRVDVDVDVDVDVCDCTRRLYGHRKSSASGIKGSCHTEESNPCQLCGHCPGLCRPVSQNPMKQQKAKTQPIDVNTPGGDGTAFR